MKGYGGPRKKGGRGIKAVYGKNTTGRFSEESKAARGESGRGSGSAYNVQLESPP